MMLRAALVVPACLLCFASGLFCPPSVTRQPHAGEERTAGGEDFQRRRQEMVANQLAARDIVDARVLAAMRKVPRHEFVPADIRRSAYDDTPLPIGEGQTISQPYIVALMTQLADPRPDHRVLEIGTGSGYQAAVLGELVQDVYTIEIVSALAENARLLLKRLGYENVHVRAGDGYQGWPEHAPFNSILVTAAAPRIPRPLLEQLKDGGKLVIPVGEPGSIQSLMVITRKGDEFQRREVIPVRFVPMTGEVGKPN